MIVKISSYQYGGYIFKPVNRTTVRKFHKDMIENGCLPIDCNFDLLLQREDFIEYIPKHKTVDLDTGWTISVNIDNWIVRQFFGYSAE